MPWIRQIKTGWVAYYRQAGRGSPLASEGPFPQKAQAQAAAAAIKRQLAARAKLPPAGRRASLEQIIEHYRESRLARGNDPMHLETGLRWVRGMLEHQGWTSLADITPQAIHAWRQGGSIRRPGQYGSPRAGAYLRAILRHAAERMGQPVHAQVLIDLRPIRVPRRPKPALADADAIQATQALADAVSPSMGACVHCLMTYGWRPITAARLTVGDVDEGRAMIATRVKGGDTISHPLTAETMRRLRPLLDRPADAPLFTSPTTGEGWDPEGRALPLHLRSYPVKAYDLKRYAISSMIAKGMDVATIQLFTGHRTPSQVLTYARSNEDRARAALTVLDGISVARGCTATDQDLQSHQRTIKKALKNR